MNSLQHTILDCCNRAYRDSRYRAAAGGDRANAKAQIRIKLNRGEDYYCAQTVEVLSFA